ncbi:PE domain-containing protein [Mycobacterium ostraviense]|uniref:PE domain-containing protein n=1 Tax=Mycobacterium ostraviense TaxID=2738409 RepID=UPI0022773750|nr:PE domain-containing protein [Mycobacterium ostraviense]
MAAADLEHIGAAVGSASAAAAGPTSSMAAAAADEVSAAIANLFGAYGPGVPGGRHPPGGVSSRVRSNTGGRGFGIRAKRGHQCGNGVGFHHGVATDGTDRFPDHGRQRNPTPGIDYVYDLLNYISPQFGPPMRRCCSPRSSCIRSPAKSACR